MLPELAADALRNLARHAQRTWRACVALPWTAPA